ncbi:hypothetical protein ACODTP_16185 [Acinetobacter pittii]|uniref:hypothetical protein n=1 Tax=Acinetobacter pittii TaxID=48296 RepID=UPI003B43B0CE
MSRTVLLSTIFFALQNSYANDFSSTLNGGRITFGGMVIDSTCPISFIDNQCTSSRSEEEKKVELASQEIIKVIRHKKSNQLNNADSIIRASENILNNNKNLDLSKINSNALMLTIIYD